MSEQTPPRKGDTVLVSFKATWDQDRGTHYWLRDLTDGTTTSVPADATVEVLERADELCRATEGATGIECGLPRRHALDVDHEGTHDPATAKHDGIGYRLTVRWPWNEWDRDAKAVGAEVPLPDWERKYPPADPLTMDQRQRLSALLVDGRKADAVALVAAIGMPHDKALKYVESMPEYQTGENHRPVDDVPLPPLHVDNEAIVAGRYREQREPRVFRPDGPEPPAGVGVLEDEGPDWCDMKYLLRTGDLWCWSPSPKLIWPDHSDPVLWERAARQAAGLLREVV